MSSSLFHVNNYCTRWRFDTHYISKIEFNPELCLPKSLDYYSKYNMLQTKVERLIRA